MENVKIIPNKLEGKVRVPSSKSLAHRAVICASLAEGRSIINNVYMSKDVKITCEAMRKLGASIEEDEDRLIIRGLGGKINIKDREIECGESGSSLRFLIPLTLLSGEKVIFKGEGKLVERPLNVYYEIFNSQNIYYENKDGKLPLELCGNLKQGDFYVRGDISSQFITGLMFSLPLLRGDSKIIVTTELESKGYIDLTLAVLKKFGIHIENRNYNEFYIPGNQKYTSCDYSVEADFSQAAFWISGGVLGNNIIIDEIENCSKQPDRAIIDIIGKMGGNVVFEGNKLIAKSSNLKGTIIDASQSPDIVPICAVLGALAEGTTEIINAKRLRIKESDRLKAMYTELTKLGAEIYEREDSLLIVGKKSLKGGIVESWNDHRIAMALAIASIKCTEPVIIKNSRSVSKSYPDFFEHFKNLGGIVSEWYMG